ncbi:MAG TPA: TonB-dependent receptor plug domain-containing protein [Hyphomonadaceae bacterium]|nr:TonB-dependent receptor plug domain-containing protein [Hyphomonadaceae bacterium]HPN07208.1 TonB-dependent receptor plug domain-containing protein [Hyphomonadaceae bacterium]
MLKRASRSASALALVFSVVGYGSASAQQATQPPPDRIAPAEDCDPDVDGIQVSCDEPRDRVVITGSNIAGAVESAALPVEVYTAEENFKSGNQSTMDFIKTLSVVGSTVGETNQFQAGYSNIGASTLNLRGLGGGRTLTIFNGRRFNENTNMIPSIALSRTEILKDGGAVIYGADATGGVVNFITRDNFDGLQVEADYRAVSGSDGDYSVSALWGKNFESANLMFSAEYSHRSALNILERDWAVRSYEENPTPWAPYNAYMSYALAVPDSIGNIINGLLPGGYDGLGLPYGSIGVGTDFTQQECTDSNGPVPGHPVLSPFSRFAGGTMASTPTTLSKKSIR